MSILDQVAAKSYSFRSALATFRQQIGTGSQSWAKGYAQGVLLALWEQQVITNADLDLAGKALTAVEKGGKA